MLLFPLPTATAVLLFLPALASANWGCRAVSDKIRWDFTALGKKHEVVSSERTPMVTNTTWQINPCGPIGKTKEEHPKKQCPAGTQGKILPSQPFSLRWAIFFSADKLCDEYGADMA